MSVTDDIIYKVIYIMVNVGQSDYRKFRVGETIRYSPSELLGILKQHKSELDPLLPTSIDAVPVRKGRWIDGWRGRFDGTRYWYRECSECGYERDDDDAEKDTNYCPNCGARMEACADI